MECVLRLQAANDALRQSNEDLEEFACAASHDLQEPLRAISICNQLLKDRYLDKLDHTAKSFIDFTTRGVRRMQILLEDLLAYSRLDRAGTWSVQRADANLALANATLNLTSAIRERGVEVSSSLLPVLAMPEAHLGRLFQNIIGNAIKYSKPAYPPGEKPIVTVMAVHQPGNWWRISVSDNGIGIKSQYLTHIFGVFNRLHGENIEGSGIGLALCQRIVERAGGRIWVESEVGCGSTFFFTLPGIRDKNVTDEARRPDNQFEAVTLGAVTL
jgi:light-regulated signal transduction histidine kinase (bacteriophytochrome)